MRERRQPDHGPGTRPGARRHLRVRSLLVLVVLVPTAGMVVMATWSATAASTERRAAIRLQGDADTLAAIGTARAAVAGEETQSAVQTIAADLGLGVDELSELYGVDYAAAMRSARAEVDADPTLATLPELKDGLARLRVLRVGIDAESVAYEQVAELFDDLASGLDAVWRARFERVREELASGTLAGSVDARVESMRRAFEAMSWGNRRAALSIRLLLAEPREADLASLLDAQSRQDAAIDDLALGLGPIGAAAWASFVADAAADRFEATLDGISAAALAGTRSPLADDPAAFGEAFVDGASWSAGLTGIVRSASIDLRAEATRQVSSATRDLQTQLGLATALTVLAVISALLLARSVTRPIRRLEAAAQQIHAGRFDLDPIATGGPRELADTASAFNEMALTLATVEAHAVALADDPDAPVLNHELPGRTGRALQVALNRLRASIRGAERHRRELEDAATHDGLTGLLNRNAAFAMIDRDLARAVREGNRLMALFVDLDGLKRINDEHGHAVGDDALRLTADAMRAATRDADVVARLGGDEFLVVGAVGEDERREVELLADRIRRALAAQELIGPDGTIPLRCSIGMALSNEDTTKAEALIHRADSALYLAKGRGRDQVAWHDPSDKGDGAHDPYAGQPSRP